MVEAELIDFVLETLGIKAAGDSATAEDSASATIVIESLHDRLTGDGLVAFELSAIPKWATVPLATMAAYELGPVFGITGERLQDLASRYNGARDELARQTAAKKPPLPVRTNCY